MLCKFSVTLFKDVATYYINVNHENSISRDAFDVRSDVTLFIESSRRLPMHRWYDSRLRQREGSPHSNNEFKLGH